jgi:WhiB family redox-sensing transcriptional regulator
MSFQMRAEVRLFHTSADLACHEDPDLFFDPHRKNAASSKCADCPFRGRCGYNAVAMGATHGVWGGVILPGDYPHLLRPVYARLAEQFEQRRHVELGDVPVAPLPDPNLKDIGASRATRSSRPLADSVPEQTLAPRCGGGQAPGSAPSQRPRSRIA